MLYEVITGFVEGDIRADWVIVGESGRIKGNMQARTMVVGGRVEGNLEASEIIEMKDKAQVFGEICTTKLAMSEGALFDGQSSIRITSYNVCYTKLLRTINS